MTPLGIVFSPPNCGKHDGKSRSLLAAGFFSLRRPSLDECLSDLAIAKAKERYGSMAE